MRVHAERAHQILELLRAVDYLALIELIGEVGEYLRGQFDAHADVDAVGLGRDIQRGADGFHPLAAAAADGDDAVGAGVALIAELDLVAALDLGNARDGGLKVEVHAVLELVIYVLQHDVVYVGAEVAHLRVQQMQAVFKAHALDAGVRGGVELRALAAVGAVYFIDIHHEVDRFLLADMLIERAAELVGDVVLTVGESARAAEAAHYIADIALDAGLDLFAVDGASALIQRTAKLEHRDLETAVCLDQLIGGEDTAGARTDNYYVVICHFESIPLSFAKKYTACRVPGSRWEQQPTEQRQCILD